MAEIKPRTLSGFMDLPPQKQTQLDRFMDTLEKIYSRYGFIKIDTPIIESSDILLAKGGGETEKQIYRFTKGDNDLALRFDLTVPLAKYAALHYPELTFPFRRLQIGKVYRGERPQRGRYREFYQADIDIVGDGALSIYNDAEMPSVIYRAFTELGLTKFAIHINNRKLLTGFYELLGLSDRAADIMRSVDKIYKIGEDKLRAILADDLKLSEKDTDKLIRFTTAKGTNAEILSSIGEYCGKGSETYDTGFDELKTVTELLESFGVPEQYVQIDLAISRGLDYYTGTVYETFMTDYPEIGSICSGGRYDNLAGYYTDKKLPGVGVSIGVTRLFFVLDDRSLLCDYTEPPADALIIPMTDDMSYSVKLSTALRDAGVRTQIYFEKKKFKAKISYASKLKIPFAIFLGEDETANNTVSIKNLDTGIQTEVPFDNASAFILNELGKRKIPKLIAEK